MNNEINEAEVMQDPIPEKETGFFTKHKKTVVITLISLVLVGCLIFATIAFIVPPIRYGNALDNIEEGNYKEAYVALRLLGDYKDCKILLENFKVVNGREETRYYDADGNLKGSTVYERNCDGVIVLSAMYDKDGNVKDKSEYVYEYDANGNVLSQTVTSEDGSAEKTEYSDQNILESFGTDYTS